MSNNKKSFEYSNLQIKLCMHWYRSFEEREKKFSSHLELYREKNCGLVSYSLSQWSQ